MTISGTRLVHNLWDATKEHALPDLANGKAHIFA